MLHHLAQTYKTDPWTITQEWSLGRYDFNQAILLLAEKHNAEQMELARKRAKNKRGR